MMRVIYFFVFVAFLMGFFSIMNAWEQTFPGYQGDPVQNFKADCARKGGTYYYDDLAGHKCRRF